MRKRRALSDTKFAYLLLAPSLILLAALIGYPMLYNMYISVLDVPVNPRKPSVFVGLSFNGLKMKENVVFHISGDVVVQVSYTEVTGGMTGREYDESQAVELGSGNYTAGTDFPAGTYTVTAVEGTGNVSSSNLLDGGMNEIFGVDDGNGLYTSEVKNVEFSDGVDLKVSGVNIRLVPAKE